MSWKKGAVVIIKHGDEDFADAIEDGLNIQKVTPGEVEELKQEIEKRNPTPIEKLNMRAANDSYPFNISPESFWKEKEATSNYRIGGEDEPDAVQYTITQGDIDDITDFQKISKDLSDSNFNQNLMNIFGLR